MDQVNNTKDYILDKIINFKNDIEALITDEDLKLKLNEKFNILTFNMIKLFIFFLNDKNVESNIKEFLTNYKIDNNETNYNIIKRHYDLFLEIKKIIY